MRPIAATINLNALRHNLSVVRAHAPTARIFSVIKANAYGHGLLRVAHALRASEGFALLDIHEAIWLRACGFQQTLLLLEGFFHPEEIDLFSRHELSPVIHSEMQLQWLENAKLQKPLSVFLKMNSGMNRLGFMPADFKNALARLERIPGVSEITLMTHFANADEAEGIAQQWECFQKYTEQTNRPKTVGNSATILRFPFAHVDWVRPGIMLYGSSPFAHKSASDLNLQPAMTLQSELISIQSIKAGESVGYGGNFTATKNMRIGVVACGYADGYPRHAGTGTPIAVDGICTQVVGRISMDMITVDLAPVSNAQIGSKVELWGNQISIDEVAYSAKTVGYELMCAIATRVPIKEHDGKN